MTPKHFKKFAQGLLIVKAKNSSFNSDFSGLPRRLPDENGTIYATDKALKYCVRKYLHNKGEKVFVWRRYKKDGNPCEINENYSQVFGKEAKTKKDVIAKLTSTIDVRLFGATYPEEGKKVSLTGTTQISYGIDRFDENLFYNNQILSPYASDKDKKQQTLGNETKALESHYVYDFVINPNNLINSLELGMGQDEKSLLLESDIELFKEAMCRGISHTTSASKIGSDAELFLFIEMNADEKDGRIESHILPMMKDHVMIKRGENKNIIDLSNLFSQFKSNYKKYISSIELYYDDNEIDLIGINEFPVKKRHIVTLEEIRDK